MVFVIGFLSGILGGMGMGGGTALIPLLRLAGVDQKSAQGMNLISFVPMAILAVYLHTRSGLIEHKHYFHIVIPALVFAVLGSFAARALDGGLLARAFGAFLVVLSVWSIANVSREN